MKIQNRFLGCLVGLAAGDAVGTTVEFKERGEFTPLTDMVGGGPFCLQIGQWTDDTSMALCLAASIIEHQGIQSDDIMNKFCDWMDTGYMSSNGRCFDIGNTTKQALKRYQQTGDTCSGGTDGWSAGNGALMRLAPIPMLAYLDTNELDDLSIINSEYTHNVSESIDACRLYSRMIADALKGESKHDIIQNQLNFTGHPKIVEIAKGSYFDKIVDDIKGTGYVVESLEAALWCFYTTDNFRDAILKAANLGDDADTTAAICGQLAGAYYGIDGIPTDWRNKLTMLDNIEEMALQLYELSQTWNNK
jgi:ADP-ribosyl-[dinitrogen reductase] hydrolase